VLSVEEGAVADHVALEVQEPVRHVRFSLRIRDKEYSADHDKNDYR